MLKKILCISIILIIVIAFTACSKSNDLTLNTDEIRNVLIFKAILNPWVFIYNMVF